MYLFLRHLSSLQQINYNLNFSSVLFLQAKNMHRIIGRFQSIVRQTARATSRRNDHSIFGGVKRITKNSINYANVLLPATRIEFGCTANIDHRSPGSLVKYYSTSNNNDSSETYDELMERVLDFWRKGDLNSALDCATKAYKKSVTPDELLNSLSSKSVLDMQLKREVWQDDFIAGLKRLDPTSEQFQTALERVVNALLTSTEEFAAVEKLFDEASKAFPNNYYVTFFYGQAQSVHKKANEAIFYLKQATKIDPTKSAAWTSLWIITGSDEFRKTAIECADATKNHLLLVLYGRHLIEKENKAKEGIENFGKALRLLPSTSYDNDLAEIVNFFVTRNDFDSAKQLLQIWLINSPRTVSAWIYIGGIYSSEGAIEKAIKCYKLALEVDPKLVAGWFNLGMILPPADGVPMLLKAIELDPNIYQAHYKLADNYYELNQHDLALKSIDKAIELNSNDPSLYYLKAIISAKLKRYRDEFLAGYKYYTLMADNPILAYHLYFVDQRFEEGLAFVRERIQENPNQSAFRLQEALYLEIMKRYDEAFKAVDVAIQVSQKSGDKGEFVMAMKTKGILLARTGNVIEAKQMAEFLQQEYGTGSFVYALINRLEGKYDEALALMEKIMNNAIYDIFRYDHILETGETLEAKGDLKAAAEQYKLVLEINPAVKRAAERLEAVQLKLEK